MTALARPAVSLRHRLLSANIMIMSTQVVQQGRVMWCRGRHIVGYGDLDKVPAVPFPRDADTLCVCALDYVAIVDGEG